MVARHAYFSLSELLLLTVRTNSAFICCTLLTFFQLAVTAAAVCIINLAFSALCVVLVLATGCGVLLYSPASQLLFATIRLPHWRVRANGFNVFFPHGFRFYHLVSDVNLTLYFFYCLCSVYLRSCSYVDMSKKCQLTFTHFGLPGFLWKCIQITTFVPVKKFGKGWLN